MKGILAFTILLLLALRLPAQEAEALFNRATDAYNEGAFEKAIEYYEEILDQGQHSAALYYNLGNAHYKLGEIAPSIYFYEKALLLNPGDPEILNNLEFARNMTLDAIQPLPQTDISRFYKGILGVFGMDGWAYTGIAFMLLFVLGYLVFYLSRSPNLKRVSLVSSLVFLFLCALSTVISYLRYREYRSDQPAIIFADEVTVRSEPNPRSQEAFRLHEGTKVQVQDSLSDWRKVLLSDGQTGWMPAASLKVLKDF